ncbi:MAG: hypothetical protein RL757_3396 [Bacteroidota bacterium]|jgi:long-chain acyl-CoA synthetase
MNQPTRLFELMEYQAANFPQSHSIGDTKSHLSTAEVIRQRDALSRGLWNLGLRRGDKVASVTHVNRPEWIILDLAMLQIGVINVPVYPTISPREYSYIFNDAAVKLCFVGDDHVGSILKKVKETKESVPSLQAIYTFDATDAALHWSVLFDNSAAGITPEIEAVRNQIQPDDLATIIYTSGTTGEPKGVMLSHDNIISNVMAVMPLFPLGAGERALSFLPLNHIFERVATYCYQIKGAQMIFTGLETIGDDLKTVKPHFFTTVPRLLEKVYEKIYNKGLELKGAKRALFFWAMGLTNDHEIDKPYSGLQAFKNKIADKLIFSKWREALGGSVKGIVVGASACPVKIARTFCFAGIPVREGYGMTELSPGVSFNMFQKNQGLLGSVGPVIDRVSVKIDASDGNYREGEGEILVAGPNVMLGYYNKPDKTDEVIKVDEHGTRWMCTGDIGCIVEKNGIQFLKITDRKKELFKTSGGKYVAPSPIESKLRENFLVEQAMVIGDGQKFVGALITPAEPALRNWCEQNNIAWTDLANILKHQSVIQKYEEVVEKYNPNFAKVEQVKKIALLPDVWEAVKTDGRQAELTPTMKLKRRVILERYQQLIDEMYS